MTRPTREILAEIDRLKSEVQVMKDSDDNADLIISMLVSLVKDIEGTGANTTLRRKKLRSVLAFAHAHLGIEEAA